MTILREWFDHFTAETGETPLMIAICEWVDRYTYNAGDAEPVPFNTLSAEILDRQFDAGFGGNESPNLCAWSESWVLFSDDYDGAEGLQWVPRNPIAHTPIRPGGG